MSQNPPQILSVKRKRTEAPVDALILDDTVKRRKAQPGFIFRRLAKPNDAPSESLAPPTPSVERRFQYDGSARSRNKVTLEEVRDHVQEQVDASHVQQDTPAVESAPQEADRPRKRPGAGSALNRPVQHVTGQTSKVNAPSAHDVRELEALSQQVEKEDNLLIPLASPSKRRPKAPAQRFAQRYPERAAELAAQDGDAMEIDSDEYVYDTYIREAVMPDADGKLPELSGTIGYIEVKKEDEDWWNGEDESDKEFDTDDEDENAEDYYANDYPEDELDEDDEYNRDPYQGKFRHGSDDEEYNLDNDDDAIGSGEDEDDLHFKMTVPKAQRVGYWGAVGEA